MARFDFKTNTSEYLDDLLGGNNAKTKEEISIDYLVEITEQPFRPYNQERLNMLAQDIRLNGLMSPLIVSKIDGSMMYEILAGRNRYNACKQLGMDSVPCIVKDGLSEAQRNLIIVNSNLMQRQSLLPSERAKAYRMQFDAYKALGIRSEWSDSQATAYRYLRLNDLNPELLTKVDNGEIQFNVGYELSGLPEDTQNAVNQYLEREPKAKAANVLKAIKDAYSKPHNVDEIARLLEFEANEKKAKPKSKLVIKMSAFASELKDVDVDALTAFILENEYDILRLYKGDS